MLEFILAHGASVLTTNFLLRDGGIWGRRGGPVEPASAEPSGGLRVTKGLTGTHRKLAARILAERTTEDTEAVSGHDS
jgi:hypothetical protein